jgi:peptidoglycan/xylan/chitin deacetylase (PgdA/CDA1 family)
MIDRLRHRVQSSKRSLLYQLGLEKWLYPAGLAKNLVLMFHNVLPKADVHLNPRNISINHFTGILDYVKRHYRVVPLSELISSDKTGGLIAITFDDGLINNLRFASKLLADRELPATFFISTPRLFGDVVLWPDELSLLLKEAGSRIEFDGKVFTRRYRSHFREVVTNSKLEDVLLEAPHEKIEVLLKDLRKNQKGASVLTDGNEDLWRVMKGEEIRLLADIPGLSIGGHGISHRNLVRLSDEELKEELCESKKYLSDVISGEVDMLAWPFGQCDERTFRAAENAGYKIQVGVQESECTISRLHVPVRLGICNDVGLSEHLHQINTLIR